MNTIAELLEFLINNFWKLSVLFAALLLSAVFLVKLVKETRFNVKLRKFQGVRRTPLSSVKHGRTAYLGTLVLIPLVFMVAFVNVARVPHLRSPDNILRIDDYEKLMDVYENYHRNFSGGHVRFYDIDSIPFAEEWVEDSEAPLSVTFRNVDTLVLREERLYVLDDNAFRVFDHAGETLLEKVKFTFESDGANRRFASIGLFVYGESVIIASHEFEAGEATMLGGRPFTAEHHQAKRVHLQVFDMNDRHTLSDYYIIDGHLKAFDVQDGHIILTVHETVELGEDMTWEEDFPAVVLNDEEQPKNYEDIMYVVGTNPTGFTSILNIDLASPGDIRHFIVLGDGRQRVLMLDKALVLLSKSRDFSNTSELFSVSDPVAALRTGVSVFALQEGVNHVRTFMVEGWLSSFNAADFHEDTLRLMTTDKHQKHRLHRIDTELEVQTDVLPSSIVAVESVHYDANRLYVSARSKGQPLHIIDIDDDGALHVRLDEGHIGLSPYTFALRGSRLLSLDFSTTAQNEIEGLDLQLYRSTEDGLEKLGRSISFTASGSFMMPIYSHAKALSYSSDNDMLFLSKTMLSDHTDESSGLHMYVVGSHALIDGGFFTIEREDPRAFYRGIFVGERLVVVSPSGIASFDVYEGLADDSGS